MIMGMIGEGVELLLLDGRAEEEITSSIKNTHCQYPLF